MNKPRLVFVAVFSIFFAVGFLGAVDTQDTRLLTGPAVGPGRIAFVYAQDLWTAGLDGSGVRRLTSAPGLESNPFFSPDGRTIAFSGQYDGNVDVFLVPAEGGVPRRLTWHPGSDYVQGFTPDGKAVLFTSFRDSATRAYSQIFRVPIEGGFPEALEIPYASKASFSPDGRFIAYCPFGEVFRQWKHYRGGTFSRIWIFNTAERSIDKIPQPEGRSNDTSPMWMGDRVYFLSDRNGEFNLFAFDPKSGKVEALTSYKDYPILDASAGGGRILFEQAGRLHLYEVAGGRTTDLKVGVAADLAELRQRFAKGANWVRSASISPSGARAVFDFRGEVVTVPAEKGDPRILTGTPGAHERSPVWSPDGKSIAYFSDESGEYELHVRGQDGRGQVKTYKLPGAGFYGSPVWSPDSKKLSFADNSLSLFWIDLETGVSKKIASEILYGPGRVAAVYSSWSPDSEWIAYTMGTRTLIQRVFVYSIKQDASHPITDGMSEAAEPVFDASGKYLYFLVSTDAGPVKQWFDMSIADLRVTTSIYLAVLRKDLPNPLAKESDEEKAAPKEDKKEDKGQAGGAAEGAKDKPEKKADEPFRIDFDGLEFRIVALPPPAGNYSGLQAGEAGKVYYQASPEPLGIAQIFGGGASASVRVYDLGQRKDELVVPEADSYELSADKKKLLLSLRGSWTIVPAAGKPEPGKGKLAVENIEVLVDPRAEWRQIFDEAWRINRDFFYDSAMHGADWKAMKAKYEVFLPDLSCRSDLNRVIQWMCSELVVGHHRVGGGDSPDRPKFVQGGLLGADYVLENGRYRFKKIYGGLNWNPELRSPLAEPGVDVKAGEYLLAVNGKDLKPPENLFARFENTAGRIVEIKVGPNPDGKGSRTLQVVPTASESALRNRDWVEGNIRKVHAATGGRVAYVYVPDTSVFGHIYFKRYFFPQADKEAIIVDERFNGGGSVADYYIDLLRKPVVAWWAMRYGEDLKTPSASIQGPKVMIINESAGSGGDLLPWMWRKFGIGKLVGTRTWGGLVGVLGFPTLLDGGYVSAPNLGIWTEDRFVVENEGVPPDIEVEQTPADVIAGHDPQLEKAVAVVMEELRANPPKKPRRPPFPVRVK